VTLSVGDTIHMRYAGSNALRRTRSTQSTEGNSPGNSPGGGSNDIYTIGVVELKPAEAVCIIDTDLEVRVRVRVRARTDKACFLSSWADRVCIHRSIWPVWRAAPTATQSSI